MKKIVLLIILSTILSFSFLKGYCNEENEYNNEFTCYVVEEQIFDSFLNDINNIDIIKDGYFKCLEFDKKGEYMFFYPNNHFDKSKVEYLSQPENIYKMAFDMGVEAKIIDYEFINVKLDSCFGMPLTIWLNTLEGVKFITIQMTPDGKESNLFDNYHMELFEPDEYIYKYSLKPAIVYVNGEKIDMPYTMIRNRGAKFCLRELMEASGFKVIWNEENEKQYGLSIYIADKEINETNGIKMYINKSDNIITDIRTLYDDESMPTLLLKYENECVYVNEKIVINSWQAAVLYNLYDSMRATDIDYKTGIINIEYEIL